MNKNKIFECPLCGEDLKLNKKGRFVNEKKNKEVNIYFCDDCDQSYALEDNNLKIAPFKADMTPIKNECLVCGNVYSFNQDVVFILKEDWRYYAYCPDCALEFLRNWLREKNPEKANEITKENFRDVEQLYDFEKSNELLERDRDKIIKAREKIKKDEY